MSEPNNSGESIAKPGGDIAAIKSAETNPAVSVEPPPGEPTKEEQWAAFEKELKESDWGHQPC